MLAQFKTGDGAVWLVDTVEGKWARVSRPVKAFWGGMEPPKENDDSKVLEGGALVPQGYGVYALEGRTPKSPAPGAGLCTVGLMPVVLGTTLFLYLRANVPVSEFTMPRPVETVRYEIAQPQGGADATQQGAEEPQGAQEPEEPGAVPAVPEGAERPAPEAGVGPGDGEVGQQVA